MAPEVVQMKPYDSKCDVFSFAILLWEILSMQRAAYGSYPTDVIEKVTVQKKRFPISRQWPSLTRSMLNEAWDDDPEKRPDMKRVATLLRGDLTFMSSDESILMRTKHMMERSNHSLSAETNSY
jgi:Protein tyrosine and serine/threonine kinase